MRPSALPTDDGDGTLDDERVPLAEHASVALDRFLYIEGNGRIGRLIAILMLIDHQELTLPLIDLSAFFRPRREDYQKQLRSMSTSGNFDPWVRFFAEAVRHQADVSLKRTNSLIDLRDQMVKEVRDAHLSGAAVPIAESLIGYPVLTVQDAANRQNVSYGTANTAISRLCKLGILREITGRSYARLFTASRVMNLLG